MAYTASQNGNEYKMLFRNYLKTNDLKNNFCGTDIVYRGILLVNFGFFKGGTIMKNSCRSLLPMSAVDWFEPWTDALSAFSNPISSRWTDRLLDKHFNDTRSFSVDIKEEDNCVVALADIPGFKKDDISVTIDNGILSISCEKAQENETRNNNYYVRERTIGRMKRQFNLPLNIDDREVKASYNDGVLTVRIPKTKESVSKRTVELT